jgi:hypothetical protein
MANLSDQQKADNLRTFFAKGVNSVTRERIFFDRLSFDLKIAAARAGYHLHIYEPDVDRDGFDIVVEDDDDAMGWFQLKAVLASAGTASWNTTVGFMRPNVHTGEGLGLAPAECGRGGGVILIEIDDTTDRGDVVYSYTDFRTLTALAERYLVEGNMATKKGPGRPAAPRQVAAETVVNAIREGPRNAAVSVPRSAFLEMKSPDALLAFMALRNSTEFAPFSIQEAYAAGVTIDEAGVGIVRGSSTPEALGSLRYHMNSLVGLLSSRSHLISFSFTSPLSQPTKAG